MPTRPAASALEEKSLLAIYLNDHLAGATAAVELARRAARSNRDSAYGGFLAQLAGDIAQDRQSLLSLMRTSGIGVDHLKVAGGWGAEKLGRLKLNGRLLGYSPLSRLVELEALLLAVEGKLALWRSLEHLQANLTAVKGFDVEPLIARAQQQAVELERNRLRAVLDAAGGERR